jgi:hypothetical protein
MTIEELNPKKIHATISGMETFLNRKNLGRELKTRQTAQRALLIEAQGQLRPILKRQAGRFLTSPLMPLR